MPPKRKGVGVGWNLYLPQQSAWIKDRIEALAQKERRSRSEIVVAILEAYFAKEAAGPSERITEAAEPHEAREKPAWLDEKVPGQG